MWPLHQALGHSKGADPSLPDTHHLLGRVNKGVIPRALKAKHREGWATWGTVGREAACYQDFLAAFFIPR